MSGRGTVPFADPHIILIDGKSGVGKSTLAAVIASALNARLVHLDDAYPGWGGLERGRDAVIRDVVAPLSRGVAGRLETWNWETNSAGDTVVIEPSEVVVVEGCGISTAESRSLASTVLWVDCDDPARLSRRENRDGSQFDAELGEWDKQVGRHIIDNDPISTATVVVNT